MPETLYSAVPSLDLSDFTSGDAGKKTAFVRKLGESFHEIGFAAIRNHGLTTDLTDRLYHAIEQFFSLPDAIKQQYEFAHLHGQRGYIGKRKETAKGFSSPDLKEFYHIGQEIPDDLRTPLGYPANLFPSEIPELQTLGIETYCLLETTGKQLLRAIALYLHLEETYFDDKITHGDSILRAIHYFPLDPATVPPEAVRAAAHGDINLITLLMGASADGLQLLRRDGSWLPVTALPDQVIVNVGDMLDRLTNNKLKSTIHRVVNPPPELMHQPRYSIPFFMHPRADMSLACLPGCIDEAHPKMYSDMTAGAFLTERLIELGLKKA